MTITIYGDQRSGNCHKVAVVCAKLDLPFSWVDVDILSGGTRTADFLARNPAGQVPVIELPGGETLAQSNAIMVYLADGSALIPSAPLPRAQMLQWLFWEQYSHEPYVATPRFQALYLGQTPEAWRMERGHAALAVLEEALAARPFLVGTAMSLADIALAAYTRLAGDAGFDLSLWPAVGRWLARTEAAGGTIDGPVLGDKDKADGR